MNATSMESVENLPLREAELLLEQAEERTLEDHRQRRGEDFEHVRQEIAAYAVAVRPQAPE